MAEGHNITCLVGLCHFCSRTWEYCSDIGGIGSNSRLIGRQAGQEGRGFRLEACRGGYWGLRGGYRTILLLESKAQNVHKLIKSHILV